MHTATDIMEKSTAIALEVTQWGGRAKLTEKDLRGDVKLPPETLASLGSKKIYDPKELNIFNTLKARAEKVLRENGVTQLIARSCWVVPTHKAAAVIAELRTIKADFDAALANFLADYDRKLEEWLRENDEWREIIEKALLTKDEVRSRISFGWHAFSFGATSDPELNDQLEDKLTGLTGRLFIEIAQIAKDSYEKSFEGRDEVMHTALGRLKTLRNKLEGFAGCSGLVLPVVEDIDRVLAATPDNGLPITGLHLLAIQGMLTLLRDPAEAMAYARKKLEGMAGEDPFASWASSNGFPVGQTLPTAVEQGQLTETTPAKPEVAAESPFDALPLISFTIKRGVAPTFEDEPEDEPEEAVEGARQAMTAAPAAPQTPEAPATVALGPVEEEVEASAPAEPETAPVPESEPMPEPEARGDEEEDGGEEGSDEDLEDEDEFQGLQPLTFDEGFGSITQEYGFQGEFDPDGDFASSSIDVYGEFSSVSARTGLDVFCQYD
jgi:hypothetical protein